MGDSRQVEQVHVISVFTTYRGQYRARLKDRTQLKELLLGRSCRFCPQTPGALVTPRVCAANQRLVGLSASLPASAVTVLPSLGGAPSTRLPQLTQVIAVEVRNNFLSVLQVISQDLSQLIIASPLYYILQSGPASSAAAVLTGVQDILELLLFYSFDFNRRRQVLLLSRQRVSSGQAEQANIEYRVNLYQSRQLQTVSVQANNFSNLIRA